MTEWRVLVLLNVVIIAGLPFLTRRGLDVSFARFPHVESALLLLAVPAAVSLVLVAAAIGVRRAWPEVLHDDRRTGSPVVGQVAALVTTIVLLCAVPSAADVDRAVIVAVFVVSALFAATEELLFRGLGVMVGRDSGSSERVVAISTSIWFGIAQLAHLMTEGATTFPIVVVVSLCGPALFLLRRATGSLLWPVAVHTLVVFGLSAGRFGVEPTSSLAFTVALGVVVVAAVGGIVGVMRLSADDVDGVREPSSSAGRRALVGVGVVVATAASFALVLVPSSHLGPQPDPTDSYSTALERYATLTAADDLEPVYEPCRSELFDHGRRTEQVIVLFHGLTNCPQQYRDFGRELFETGANVLILRAPRHGLADSFDTVDEGVASVDAVGRLTASELRDYADDAIDIAAGLGDSVVVSGLSMGGVLATWVAQFRPDVDRVVAVAPAVSIPGVPHMVTTAFINVFNRVSNLSLPSSGKLDHAYLGESTGALGAMFLLAQATENESTRVRSAVDEVIVVLNPTDNQVDNDHVRDLVDGWGDGDGEVDIVMLPDIGLPHDVIDEDQETGDVDVVYPILFPLILDGHAAS